MSLFSSTDAVVSLTTWYTIPESTARKMVSVYGVPVIRFLTDHALFWVGLRQALVRGDSYRDIEERMEGLSREDREGVESAVAQLRENNVLSISLLNAFESKDAARVRKEVLKQLAFNRTVPNMTRRDIVEMARQYRPILENPSRAIEAFGRLKQLNIRRRKQSDIFKQEERWQRRKSKYMHELLENSREANQTPVTPSMIRHSLEDLSWGELELVQRRQQGEGIRHAFRPSMPKPRRRRRRQ